MKSNNLFKKLFATTAVFATLATTGVTATVHADDSSSVSGISTQEMNQYFKDHGAQNWNTDNQDNIKTTIDPASKKYGYRVVNMANNQKFIYQFNKKPSQMQSSYYLNVNDSQNTYLRNPNSIVYIDGISIALQSNGYMIMGHNTGAEDKKQMAFKTKYAMNHTWLKLATTISGYATGISSYNKFVNINQLYRRWLHIDIDKIMTNKQPKNWETKYANWEPTKGVIKDGYTKAWVNKKLDWAIHNPNKAKAEMIKIAKQVTLKDQRTQSTKNDFDNTTLK
ncbi:hypothetical protein ACYATO_08755 [Lactobacillaceae bacterium Melli_B3]